MQIKHLFCCFSFFCYPQIIYEQNLILTDLFNIQSTQDLFQVISCLQMVFSVWVYIQCFAEHNPLLLVGEVKDFTTEEGEI